MCDDREKASNVSVRSLVDPQMAGRMFVQRGYLSTIILLTYLYKNTHSILYKIL